MAPAAYDTDSAPPRAAAPSSSVRWWEGPLLGLVSALAGLAVAELLAGLLADDGGESPVLAVGQAVIDRAPTPVKDWAIQTLGTNDKPVLVAGTLVLLAAFSVLAGVLARRGRVAAAVGIVSFTSLLAVAAVLSSPGATFAGVVPPIAGGVVSAAVIMRLAGRRVVQPSAAPGVPQMAAVPMKVPGRGTADRRTFVFQSIAVVSGAAIVGGFARLVRSGASVAAERSAWTPPRVTTGGATLPPGTDFTIPAPFDPLTPFVTPNDDFYRIDTALSVPQLARDDWRLRIHGMVDQELEITFAELLERPQVEAHVTLSCVSNTVGGGLVGNALWQGVRLDELLAEAGIHPEATQLVSRSVDGWTCGTPVSSVTDGRMALLAIAMNGEPLPVAHGYPVRMVVPGEYGYVSATKWVVDMELTTWDAYDAYWVPRGWAQQAPMKTLTRIETPRDGRELAAGLVPVAGTAWAVHRGIGAVEVRIDGGEWQRAELGAVPSTDTWRKWRLDWEASPGDHRIEARAVDGFGEVQTDEVAPPAPDGASGYHIIDVTVGA